MAGLGTGLAGWSDRELVDACLSAAPGKCGCKGAGSGGLAAREAAWEELIRRYERLIYSVPIRLGMNAQEAVDVFQSVCFILFRKLGSLRDRERIYSWLITTTTRECWRIGAQKSRQSHCEVSFAAPDFVSAEQIAIERYMTEQQSAALQRALAELSPKCRELLSVLYFAVNPPTYQGVASLLKMPVSSVGPTRSRCLQKLKRLVESELGLPHLT